MSNSPFQNPFYRLLLLGASFVGIVIAPMGMMIELNRVTEGRASREWPTTPGTISATSVEMVRSHKPSRLTYFPRVEFDYAVDGKAYHGDRISAHGSATLDRVEAEEHSARYPVGSRRPVRYKPDQPQISLLEPGLSKAPAGPFVIVLALFAAGVVTLVLWSRTLPARQWR